MGKVDTEWFRGRLSDVRMSQRKLAAELGLDPAAVSYMLRGKRGITIEEATKIAKLLKATTTEVMRRTGQAVNDDVVKVPIVGYVNGNSIVTMVAKHTEDRVIAPADVPRDSIAIQCRTQMSAAAHMDGYVLFTGGSHSEPEPGSGLSMIALKNGQVVIGHLLRGYKAGSYNILLNLTRETMENVDVIWISRVLWIKPS